MASFNRVFMIGNLTKDPEYKQSSSQALCKLNIASNRKFRNKQTGAMVQEVCFIDVDVWGPQADSCRQYLEKGRPILVEGRLKLDTWEADGQTRRKHVIVADRIVFLGNGQQGQNISDETQQENNSFSPSAKIKNSNQDMGSLGQTTEEVSFKDEPPFEEDLPF